VEGLEVVASIQSWPIGQVVPYHRNARLHTDEDVRRLAEFITRHGFNKPIEVDEAGVILCGHRRLGAAKALGMDAVPVIVHRHLDEAQKAEYRIADNRLTLEGEWDEAMLGAELDDIVHAGGDPNYTGLDSEELERIVNDYQRLVDGEAPGGSNDGGAAATQTLADRFLIAPFTVLNAREGWWQNRKRAWVSLGIQSELGRSDYEKRATNNSGGVLLTSNTVADASFYTKKREAEVALGHALTTEEFLADYYVRGEGSASSGTSIFDPVLTELLVRWFCPPGGTVVDPFAGGSVRGVVSAKLGRAYYGVDLREDQVAANREQWATMTAGPSTVGIPPDYQPDLTPVERRGMIWMKRDDTFAIAGVRGGKVRTCWGLAQGATGLVTAGSRMSPQCNIVAHVGKALGIPVVVHTPVGVLGPELEAAEAAGATIVQHKAGYNTVIVARARKDAADRGWREIPFGMECKEAVDATAGQAANLPDDCQRIVVPVGSGMSLAGILHGLERAGRTTPVLGVVVGADPTKRLDAYAPKGWRDRVTLVPSGVDYHDEAAAVDYEGVVLDPIYEAKCVPFLKDGDCLWVVGIRQSRDPGILPSVRRGPDPTWIAGDGLEIENLLNGCRADLVLTCPPYGDLEVYSDDPRDISTMDHCKFLVTYRAIVAAAIRTMKPDRFAAVVVGDVRDSKGNYRNLVSETIDAFRAAGADLYNEAILVTAVASLSIRAGRQFSASRKLGKTHQNVLIFVVGDPKRATAACGAVEVDVPDESFAEGKVEA